MSFQQITLQVAAKKAEAISDLFFAMGALSVTIEDAYAGTELEQPIFGEPGLNQNNMWQVSVLSILTESTTDIKLWLSKVETILDEKFQYQVDVVENEDWVRKTQSQFNPIQVSAKLYIVPSWHETPDKSATTITLDPGLAFGTGSHPTTFMCLQWLSNNCNQDTTVLDYGCGSGILAITAQKLGAKEVYGVDIDPQAIESSIENAKHNNVSPLFTLPNQLPNKTFDIVVANILANPLRMLAPALAKLTSHHLILSGLLEEQASELVAIYKNWFPQVTVAQTMDGWALLECSKL